MSRRFVSAFSMLLLLGCEKEPPEPPPFDVERCQRPQFSWQLPVPENTTARKTKPFRSGAFAVYRVPRFGCGEPTCTALFAVDGQGVHYFLSGIEVRDSEREALFAGGRWARGELWSRDRLLDPLAAGADAGAGDESREHVGKLVLLVHDTVESERPGPNLRVLAMETCDSSTRVPLLGNRDWLLWAECGLHRMPKGGAFDDARGGEAITAAGLDDDHAYWSSEGKLLRAPLAGEQRTQQVGTGECVGKLAFDASRLYCILERPSAQGEVVSQLQVLPLVVDKPERLATVFGRVHDLAVDDDHVYVAFDAAKGEGQILRVSKQDGKEQKVLVRTRVPRQIALADELLLWRTVGRFAGVFAMPKQGGSKERLFVPDEGFAPTRFALAGEDLFVSSTERRISKRRFLDGETSTWHRTLDIPYQLHVDEKTAYWLEYSSEAGGKVLLARDRKGKSGR